jgi:hypothetical protein
MNTGTDATADTAARPTAPEHEEVLALLEDGIREAHRKTIARRCGEGWAAGA